MMLLWQRTKAYSTLTPGRVAVTKATSYADPNKVLTDNIAFGTVQMKQWNSLLGLLGAV